MSFKPDYVCSNPNCASYGSAHYNCKCPAPEGYASGGAVHYCTHALAHAQSCEHFADGAEVESNLEFQNNPGLAVDHAIAHHGLSHTLSRSGFTKSQEPGRAHAEFLDNHRHGRKTLHTHTESLLEKKYPEHKPDHDGVQALQAKIEKLKTNPESGLEIGGELDTHGPLIAAKAAATTSYLESIKPKPVPAGPLDMPSLPSKAQEHAYQRQVELAEKPTLIYERVRSGKAVPQDFQTLQTLYPKLRQSISDRAFETLATAKANNRELTHKQKRQLGALIGQPVTLQQTPAAIAAIMHANAPAFSPPPQKPSRKASGTELRQINKVNEMSETPLQRLQSKGI